MRKTGWGARVAPAAQGPRPGAPPSPNSTAMAGDTSNSQFWVEKERLLFVRLIQRTTGRNGQVRMLAAPS